MNLLWSHEAFFLLCEKVAFALPIHQAKLWCQQGGLFFGRGQKKMLWRCSRDWESFVPLCPLWFCFSLCYRLFESLSCFRQVVQADAGQVAGFQIFVVVFVVFLMALEKNVDCRSSAEHFCCHP